MDAKSLKCSALRKAMALVMVALFSGGLHGALAQTDCVCPGKKVQLGSIKVDVVGQRSGDKLIWVLARFPGSADPSDLSISDSDLRQRIQQAIEGNTGGLAPGQFGFTDDAEFNFPDILILQLASAGISFSFAAELEAAPPSEGATRESVICVCGSATTPPPSPVSPPAPDKYRVVVVIRTATAAEVDAASPRVEIIQVDTALSETGNLPVRLYFTKQDLRNAATDPAARSDPKARVLAELAAVARQMVTLAQTRRLLDGAGKLTVTPTDDVNAAPVREVIGNRTAFEVARDDIIQDFRKSYDLTQRSPPLQLDSQVQWRPLELIIGPCLPEECNGGPGEPCDQLCGSATEPVFVLAISNVQIVRHIALKVQPDETDRKFQGQEVGGEFNELRRNIARKLNQELVGKLAAQPGHVVTWETIEQDWRMLCPPASGNSAPSSKCKSIEKFLQLSSPPRRQQKGAASPNLAANATDQPVDNTFSDDSALIYEVERKRKAPGALSLGIGGQYSPADSFLGTISMKEYNLLGLGKLALGERASLDFSRGDQVQKVRFQLSRPFPAPDRAGFRLNDISVSVNYLRDQNQRLGNLTPEEIEARETGSVAAISFGYDSFQPEDYLILNCDSFKGRKRTHVNMRGEASLGFRDLDIPESRRLLALTGLNPALWPAPNTQIAPLGLTLNFMVRHDARPANGGGLGAVNFSLDAVWQRGLDWMGADYSYRKAALTAKAEIVFGKLSPEDFFLRYTQGIGRGSEDMPATELFRLGGLGNVRGMEEGEFIGRRLNFGQVEFGINVFALWHYLRRTAAPELNRTPCSPSAGTDDARSPLPFDPAGIYLKTFYDFARVTDPTSFAGAGGAPRPLNQFANGYGLAVELRNLGSDLGAPLSFSFGYGRSPQSSLHRSGVLFTGVSFSF